MAMGRRARGGAWRIGVAALALTAASARADEKLILARDAPKSLVRLKVAPDGRRICITGLEFHVFDAEGAPVDRIGVPQGSTPKDLIPLPDGWFIACDSYFGGHLALCRPDGTEARVLVGKGGDETHLRADMTGWTSPFGAAIDVGRRRIFALDTTLAAGGAPDPDWSRIATFDFDGKYLGDIQRYDAKDPRRDEARRTWYDDIAVDPARERVYVLARRTGELQAFGYDGKPAGSVRAPGEPGGPGGGGIAVFHDGRVAVGRGREVRVFDRSLRPVKRIDVAPVTQGGILDLEADEAGRLYAVVSDPTITFLRWGPELGTPGSFGPDYLKIGVDFPGTAATAGTPLVVKARATGRPAPAGRGRWRAMARPSDGSDLVWRSLPLRDGEGELHLATPRGLRGLYDVAVRFGEGPIDAANVEDDPHIQQTLAFVPRGATRSVSAFTADGRRAYRQGEPIPVQLVRRGGDDPAPASVRLDLGRGEAVLATARTTVGTHLAGEVPAALTRRLPPGRYRLAPAAEGHEGYGLAFDIAPAGPDSPMQRILYHEFAQVATQPQVKLHTAAERLAFVRDHARAAAGLGFTRETDRLIGKVDKATGPVAWRRGVAPADLAPPGAAPADYYAVPGAGASWEADVYLDQAVRRGLAYDTQLLEHCAGVRFRESRLRELAPVLQRGAQWLGRYPAFYGFNYNDEMFFGGFANAWTKDDDDWLKRTQEEKFPGRPRADVYEYALRVMYDRFNEAVRRADPSARVTATPMWQFPAVEGSYAPTIYRGMSETYSHFLSEGYAPPWYAAHSAAFLRRPGLPLMGVFDNGRDLEQGSVYLKNALQVAARGAQGVGIEHVAPFEDPQAADAYRTANLLTRLYGPVFAEAPPADEAAVLYSRSQDLAEARAMMGTPHWERVFALHGAGLMAGVPMEITYEEDVAAGRLLDGGRPRVPMLLLAGQARPLPAGVREAIAAFVAAGGRVFTDADCADFPGATRLDFRADVLKTALQQGYAADSWHPLAQPPLEALAARLAASLGPYRRFPIDSDDPWVSKSAFDGGAVRYLMVATETGPFPWDAGAAWSLGVLYNNSAAPKTVTLSFPAQPGVAYDVFDHAIVRPAVAGKTARLSADLTAVPGRLFALAPAPLGAPKVSARVAGDAVEFTAEVVDEEGRALLARVPIRIRLVGGGEEVAELVRGTGADGTFVGSLALPATAESWTLEVTELLGGKGSVATLAARAPLGPLLVRRPDVEPLREDRIGALLKESGGALTLCLPRGLTQSPRQFEVLAEGFRARGIELKPAGPLPKEPERRVYLALGIMSNLAAADQPDDLLWLSWTRGLLPHAVSGHVPGPGRGLFTAVFAPRGEGEDAIALLGGDADGLAKTVAAFGDWLATPGGSRGPAPGPRPAAEPVAGKPAEVAPVPRLSDRVGVKLAGVAIAGDGRHLVVTADGYGRNLALIEDQGARARVVRAARVGQAPAVEGAFVSDDGRRFGASARTIARFGEGFHLIDAETGRQDVFAAFGDLGWHRHRFGAAGGGDVVLAPGPCGVACWRREGDGGAWREAWAIEDWKRFPALDWPVSADAERLPQSHAVVPRGADYALVLQGETSNNGWVTPNHPAAVRLAAVGLADGKERWRFDVPLPKALLFPTLRLSPDGSRCVLQVQVGAWGTESFRFYGVAEGKALASWDARTAPIAVAVADGTGVVATAAKDRLLEVRRADGLLLQSRTWRDQPVGLAFAADGVGMYVADDAGWLTYLDARGREAWSVGVGGLAALAARGDRVYAAGRDGRLRCFGGDGRAIWTLDCNPAMAEARPMEAARDAAKLDGATLHQARRPPITSADVPAGPNLLRDGRATLTVGGTPGWMSEGKVQVRPEELTNGKRDDVAVPWLDLDELFWDSQGGRQVWAEVAFKAPADVKALTVFENPRFPDSWPTDGLVQVWDEPSQSWKTAARATFLDGPINTYPLDLKKVKKLRYVPWGSYFRNFYTSEIEVR